MISPATLTRFGLAAALLSLSTFTASAELVTHGNFETGDLTGWTTFVTPGGNNGSGLPVVATFDLGSGASDAAEFNVGEVDFDSVQRGGGLVQTVSAPDAATYDFSVQFASTAPFAGNASGGVFSLLIDGVVVASDNVGGINLGQTIEGTLSGTDDLTAGDHTIAIQVTRPYISVDNLTPLEYFDNVSLSEEAPATPEPGTMWLLGTGLVGVLAAVRRRRAA